MLYCPVAICVTEMTLPDLGPITVMQSRLEYKNQSEISLAGSLPSPRQWRAVGFHHHQLLSGDQGHIVALYKI